MAKRLLALVFLGLAFIPLYYYGQSYVNAVETYPGDEIVEKPCRICGGGGVDADMDMPAANGRCMFCRGAGTVRVLVPGPNHPTKIWGAVIDGEMAGEYGEYAMMMSGPIGPGWLFQDMHGGIPNIDVTFVPRDEDAETFKVRSNGTGKFVLKLPPGVYDIDVAAPAFHEFEDWIEIEPLEEEIWLEHATLIENPDELGDGGQARYGIQLPMVLWR